MLPDRPPAGFVEIEDLGQRIATALQRRAIAAVPNQRPDLATVARHRVTIASLCPRSGNPLAGSWIEVRYRPMAYLLEVVTLKAYVEAFRGGRHFADGTFVRDMEHVPQRIAADAREVVGVPVTVRAHLLLQPDQELLLTAKARGP